MSDLDEAVKRRYLTKDMLIVMRQDWLDVFEDMIEQKKKIVKEMDTRGVLFVMFFRTRRLRKINQRIKDVYSALNSLDIIWAEVDKLS